MSLVAFLNLLANRTPLFNFSCTFSKLTCTFLRNNLCVTECFCSRLLPLLNLGTFKAEGWRERE